MNTILTETMLKTTSTRDEINIDYLFYTKSILKQLESLKQGEYVLIEQGTKLLFGRNGIQLGYTEKIVRDGKIYFKSVFRKDVELQVSL